MATKKTTKAAEPETVEATVTAEAVEETAAAETAEAVEITTVRAKVIKAFCDKNTNKIVNAGSVLALTPERFEELSPRYVKRW